MWCVAFTEMLPSSASVQLSHSRAMQTASPKHSQVWKTSSELITHTSVRKSLVHWLLPSMISMIRTSFTSSSSILPRYVMSVWRDKAMLQREFRLMEQEAQNHYQYFLQFKVKQLPQSIFILTSANTLLIFFLVKVFIAWREETASAVSACRQQRGALTRFQMFQNKGTADLIST